MKALAPLVLVALALIAPVALAAYPSVTIDATVTSQTYAFQVEPPLIIKIDWQGLQPNTGVDNLALSFRDNSTTPQEIFVLYIKTNGDLVLHVPIAGVTTDQLLGSWQSLDYIKVRYWSDKLQVLDPSGNVIYEVSGSFPAINDVWAHSSNSTTAAFTAGSITVSGEDDPTVTVQQVTSMVYAFVPMIALMVGLAFSVGLLEKLMKIITSVIR